MDDPDDALKQNEINKKVIKPFNLLLTARIFFDSPVLKADVKAVQDPNHVQSRAQLKREANMKRAAKVAQEEKEKQEQKEADIKQDKKWQRLNDQKTLKTNVSY